MDGTGAWQALQAKRKMKLPYGGFDPRMSYSSDDPWLRLKTIAEYLEDGERIPPELAQWLGEAIKRSSRNEDTAEFLCLLGLTKPRGKPPRSKDDWFVWGGRVCELEDQGCKAEEAIHKVLQETNEKFGRTQMQKLRDKYRKARSDAQRA